MTTHHDVLERILAERAIAILRLDNADDVPEISRALGLGGVGIIEITMTMHDAPGLIRAVRAAHPHLLVGAGTVLGAHSAESVLEAGAQFVVSPIIDAGVLRVCADADTVCMQGAYTPAEIVAAWTAGADVVKVFPSAGLGPRYIADVHGPFPGIRMMPTGGVTRANARAWLDAGACAIGLGADLVDTAAVAARSYEAITVRARELRTLIDPEGGKHE